MSRLDLDFPLLLAAAGSKAGFESAISTIAEGLEVGSIRNVVLQESKFTLSRVVDEAWRKHVVDPFFCRNSAPPDEIQNLYWSINLMCLHDVIATSKKVSKCQLAGPEIEAMRTFCAEVLPLALAVASLKDKVAKGRAPSTAPAKPQNPNKMIKTCPVCFRPIAVQGVTMAHHGYQRPGQGWQTASCPGIRFKPLEVSSEGLQWLVETMKARLVGLRHAMDNQATHPEYLMAKRTHSGPLEKISRDDPLWPRAFSRHIAEVESDAHQLTHALPGLEKKLADWAPAEAE